jgi:hypothetical protein
MCHYTQFLFVEMGSAELFAQAGLELLAYQSLPPK